MTSLKIYEFENFRIEVDKRLLLRDGVSVPLTPKVFDTLLHLVKRSDYVVDKEELMRAIWPDTVVEENNLNQNISTLRKVLGQNQGENRYILTIPGKGYRFVGNISNAGESQLTSATEKSHATIAVLPFENLSADLEKEYLADGLTEETIALLGQIDPNHLRVIGRTSVMAYKRTTKALAEIGRELDASHVVESSLRAEGGRLRITAKLIRARDQVQIWSSSYDSEPVSMLAFQRELAAAIAEQIRLQLSPERLTALARRQTKNAEAYDLYLRGRYFWHQLSPPTTKRAIEHFTRATQIDPNYALAWSGIADTLASAPINGDAPSLDAWKRAREAAARAIAAEPDLAEAQTSQGFVKFWFDWEWSAAEAAYRKAIPLDPNYPLSHRMLGIVLAHMGRHQEAKVAMRRAREIEPRLAVHQALSAYLAFLEGDFDAAIQFGRRSILIAPDFWIGHFQLGQVYVGAGKVELALDSLNQAIRLSGGNSKAFSLRAYLLAKLGRKDEALEVIKTLQALSRERYIPPYAAALIYAGLEQRDLALQSLESAYEVRDVHLIFLPIDPKWDPLRSDAGFVELLQRCGFH